MTFPHPHEKPVVLSGEVRVFALRPPSGEERGAGWGAQRPYPWDPKATWGSSSGGRALWTVISVN